jgi:hypothetical protein
VGFYSFPTEAIIPTVALATTLGVGAIGFITLSALVFVFS